MPVDLHYEHGRTANRWRKRKVSTPQIPTPDHTPTEDLGMPDPELLAAGAVTLPAEFQPTSPKPTSPPPTAPPAAVPASPPPFVTPGTGPTATTPMSVMMGSEELSHLIDIKAAMVERAQALYQQALTSLQIEQNGLAALRAVKDRSKSGSVVFRLDV